MAAAASEAAGTASDVFAQDFLLKLEGPGFPGPSLQPCSELSSPISGLRVSSTDLGSQSADASGGVQRNRSFSGSLR
jgi:hypothetical protein